MATSITITIPANRNDLRQEIEKTLGAYATIRTEVPKSVGGQASFTGWAEIKVILKFAKGALVDTAVIVTAIIGLIDWIKQRGQATEIHIQGQSGERKPIEDVDKVWLHRQLGDPFAAFRKKLSGN